MIEKELGNLTRAKDPFVMFIAKTWANEARQKKKKKNKIYSLTICSLSLGFIEEGRLCYSGRI